MTDSHAVFLARNIMRGGFNLGRTALLLRNRMVEEAPTLGIGIAAVVGVSVLNFLVSGYFFLNRNTELWPAIIGFSGLLFSAHAFKGMHDGKSGTDWLLLPATALEKFAAAIVAYVVVFPIVAALGATGLSALFALVEAIVGKSSVRAHIWTPWNIPMLVTWGQYAVMAVLFLAGSASFRKNAFLKTAALGVAYCLTLALILFVGGWLVTRANGSAIIDATRKGFSHIEFYLSDDGHGIYSWIGRLVCYVILPLFGLAYGYFRVFEKEARDEVQ